MQLFYNIYKFSFILSKHLNIIAHEQMIFVFIKTF
jgi:hypothetical protein